MSSTQKATEEQTNDGLSTGERLGYLALFLIAPCVNIIVSSALYYAWKKDKPQKAGQINFMGWLTFLVLNPLLLFGFAACAVYFGSDRTASAEVELAHPSERAALRAIYDGIAAFDVDDQKHVVHVEYSPLNFAFSFQDTDAESLAKLTKLRYLELPLSGNEITDHGMRHLATLTELDQLSVTGAKNVTAKGFAHLKSLGKLTGLSLGMSSIDDEGLEHVAVLTGLEFLDLTGCEISDDGVRHLASLNNLKSLALVSTGVTDESLKTIGTLPALESLDMRGCNITDDGLAALSGMPKLKRIEAFRTNYGGGRITDEGLQHLSTIKTLNHINVTGNRVTGDGANKLREALPKCEVVIGNAAATQQPKSKEMPEQENNVPKTSPEEKPLDGPDVEDKEPPSTSGSSNGTPSRDSQAASDRLLFDLRGHQHNVMLVAFSPSGDRIASASTDKTVRIWDSNTGNPLFVFMGHTEWVRAVAFAPNGKQLATGGGDKIIRVWNPDDGRESLQLRGHLGTITSVEYSPDGRLLASGSYDGTIKIWDTASGREMRTLTGHKDKVWKVAFSPDGKMLGSASADGTARIWDVQTGALRKSLGRHTATVYCIAFSPDGRQLATSSADRTLKVWDAADGRETATLQGHSGSALHLVYSPDGERLLSCSVDKSVKLWDLGSGLELTTIHGHRLPVGGLDFSPDGKRIVTGAGKYGFGRSGELKVWDVSEFTAPDTTTQEALKANAKATSSESTAPRVDNTPTRLASRNELPRDLALLPDFPRLNYPSATRGNVRNKTKLAVVLPPKAFPAREKPADPLERSSILLDGKGDCVKLPNLTYDGESALTVEAWVRPSKLSGQREIICNAQKAGLVLGIYDGVCKFIVHDRTAYVRASARAKLRPNSIAHLAGVYGGSSISLFVNGQREATVDMVAKHRPAVMHFIVGANPEAGGRSIKHFAGLIDEVRISSTARYNAPFIPARRHEADEFTIALLHFDERKGLIANDASGSKHHGKVFGSPKWVPERSWAETGEDPKVGAGDARVAKVDSNSAGERVPNATSPRNVPKAYVRYAVTLIQEYDTNKDQVLDKDEWSKMEKSPAKADTNGDGRITPQEMAHFKFNGNKSKLVEPGPSRGLPKPAPRSVVLP